jgi:hypothetical protein
MNHCDKSASSITENFHELLNYLLVKVDSVQGVHWQVVCLCPSHSNTVCCKRHLFSHTSEIFSVTLALMIVLLSTVS